MNAETPAYDLAECTQFISYWCKQTLAPHITLTAIVPDGPTTTATFMLADTEKATVWIARHQNAGRNIYFQVNEPPARCAKKPTKDMMQAALCRHADIDPHDSEYPYIEERGRLHKLAALLHSNPAMPPTAILDPATASNPCGRSRGSH